MPKSKRKLSAGRQKCDGAFSSEGWSFHLVPPHEREACLFYECCREALREDARNEHRPWLHLPASEREARAQPRNLAVRDTAYLARILRSFPYSVTEEWLTSGIYPGQAKTLVLLEVDWSKPDPKLKRDFAKWLVERRTAPGSVAFKHKNAKSDPGRKQNANEKLVDLAIYRAWNAGYSAKQMPELLSSLIEGLDPHLNKTLHSQAVYDACKRASALINAFRV